MNDIPMPLGLAILFIIFLFIIGQWQIALFNIALLIIQLIGCIFFDTDPKTTIMILAIIGLAIWLFLCFIGVCEFPKNLG